VSGNGRSAGQPGERARRSRSSAPLLEVSGLISGYGGTTVVRGIDLRVDAGEVVALLGPNGAGKTTTMLTVAGSVPLRGGTVRMFGSRVSSALPVRVRQGLGLVTEERMISPGVTPRRQLRLFGVDADFAVALFPELEPHLDRKSGLLSGGQQQMLALASALGRNPELLLSDELSFGLAPVIVRRLLKAVRAAADGGAGVLLVEQHVHGALEIADRFYVMRRGVIERSGPAGEELAALKAGETTSFGLGTAGTRNTGNPGGNTIQTKGDN
jgi:branched-chain amino acid transport system ATP-binding protein